HFAGWANSSVDKNGKLNLKIDVRQDWRANDVLMSLARQIMSELKDKKITEIVSEAATSEGKRMMEWLSKKFDVPWTGEDFTKGIEKAQGEPCEQGETAARSGCIPASGEGGKRPSEGREEQPDVKAIDRVFASMADPGQEVEQAYGSDAVKWIKRIANVVAMTDIVGSAVTKPIMDAAGFRSEEHTSE